MITRRKPLAETIVTGKRLGWPPVVHPAMRACWFIVLAALVRGAACGASPTPPGLYVQNGVLRHQGQPYRGIGANYFSLFSRQLRDPANTTGLAHLKELAQARIPFVRFMGCGYWPMEQNLYLTDRAAYFQRLDQVVQAAEHEGIGLIPSLFWHYATVSDLVGEPLDELGNPQSQSIAYIRRYTQDVVCRYKDSPAIWGWEFGNEYNLACDLPNAADHRPPVVPQLGTARQRTAHDELKYAQYATALAAFAQTVRQWDPSRIILSGNAIPRPSAWHNVHEGSWTPDTADQFAGILARDNPDPLDTICVHIYPEAKGRYAGGATSLSQVIGLARQRATAVGKPLFIGEFGVGRDAGNREAQQAVLQQFLDALVQQQVALAAFWVFDLDQQERDWNVSFENDRAYMIDMVRQANRRLAAATP